LFIAFITRKSSADYLIKMQNILHKIYIVSNLPLGILAISLCTYYVLRYGEEHTGFLVCIILFIISFISECLLDKLSLPDKTREPVHDMPNPIFPAIDLLNEMSEQKTFLLSAIREYNTSVLDNIKNTHNNICGTNNILNTFLHDEKQKNDELGGKIKICNKIFEGLGNSADLARKNVVSLNQKLESSCTAIAAVENQEKMLKDINMTFIGIFNEQSIDINVKIQRILDNLSNITYKCSNIQNFPKPYKEMIDLYGSRIETVFSVLDRKKFNALLEEHMQAGKAYVYNNPIKAIAELNEAIRINSENADSYYYRGLAYQLKTNPDYKAAMKDLEKALELKPNSNLYSRCIEELKAKINEK
jgi:tetratricopeptide (TPR) repeat protein